ncbi:MAG: pilin [Bacillota bacterium]|nr:pilin [Bacillota bacterium]
MKKKYLSLSIIALLPATVFADISGKITGNTQSTDFKSFLGLIQSWLLGIVGGLAILFIVYGGFLYVTSAGNQQRIELAKKTLTYAILGLILVALTGLILNIITGGFLTSIFGSKTL